MGSHDDAAVDRVGSIVHKGVETDHRVAGLTAPKPGFRVNITNRDHHKAKILKANDNLIEKSNTV